MPKTGILKRVGGLKSIAMKKIFAVSIFSVLLMSILSFKNEYSFEKNIANPETIQRGIFKTDKKIPEQNWSVSEYGFLIFPVIADLEEYLELIKTKTHGQAQAYLDSLRFASLGATLYDGEYLSQPVTGDEAINYVLSTSMIFQLQGIIIRPVSEAECQTVNWEFVLAMVPGNLNSTSYDYLERGIYDENTMNKFATNPAVDTALTSFMSQTPSGYEETDANDCPSPQAERKPFWGWGPCICTECDEWGKKNCHRNYYVFWILVYVHYDPWINCNQTCSVGPVVN
jgi:hypothetical protein